MKEAIFHIIAYPFCFLFILPLLLIAHVLKLHKLEEWTDDTTDKFFRTLREKLGLEQ